MAIFALFPEAAFGPALNSVAIGQALRELGHDVVFLSGHGFKLHRCEWTEAELAERIRSMLTDEKMRARLDETSRLMRAEHGPSKAARILDSLSTRERPGRKTLAGE